MTAIKVSLITVVYNAEAYIQTCIDSVIGQTYPHIEYIIIDGGSTDGTLARIGSYGHKIAHFLSEKDKGMYDALNKGISLAKGDVVGILNADDMLASPTVIEKIVQAFEDQKIDAVYGNLNYVDRSQPNKIIRKWVSKSFTIQDFEKGWMPAHPTLYIRREAFENFGNYSLQYGTCADYELMLRFLYQHKICAHYLDELIVNMRIGGMSNATLSLRWRGFLDDYKAAKANGIPFALTAILLKKLGKIPQFFA